MKHNVIFRLDIRKDSEKTKRPINGVISFAGQKIKYFTGFRIDVDKWEAQRAKRGAKGLEGNREVLYSDINKRLEKIEAALTTLFADLKEAPGRETIITKLDETCNKHVQVVSEVEPQKFLPAFRDYVASSRLSAGRKKHAYSTINHWERFNANLTFEQITPDTLRAFERFLLSETDEEKKPLRGLNTLHTIFAITRTFWNYSRKLQPLPYPFDSYKVPAEVYGTPIFITLEERNLLFEKEIESERLRQVRDIFIFQCSTGARVGDMIRWTRANISGGVLSYIARKTKEGKPVTTRVPLTAKATAIIARYDMPDGRLLPFISEQKYNDYLKELFKLAKLTRTVTRQHPTTREPETVKLCDIVSSHMARRTFVGNMFGKQDSAIIASMSGHVANSKAFARYYNVSEELQRNAINAIE
jgi:integrase